MMRSSNPVFRRDFGSYGYPQPGGFATVTPGVMTIEGTATKAGILLLIASVVGVFAAAAVFITNNITLFLGLTIIGLIGGLVAAIVTIWKKHLAFITAPIYAAFEGLVLGAISIVFEIVYPGIVLQAIVLTFLVFAGVLAAYKTRLLRATPGFVKGIVAATGAIMVLYLIGLMLTLFGVPVIYLHGNGPIAIGFSLFVCAIAALNFVLDFDFIERGATQGAPKWLEWYGAFGLMVTLVWLYLEILRLLSKLRSN